MFFVNPMESAGCIEHIFVSHSRPHEWDGTVYERRVAGELVNVPVIRPCCSMRRCEGGEAPLTPPHVAKNQFITQNGVKICEYSNVKKGMRKILFECEDKKYANVTDRRTDGQTDGRTA